MTVTLLPCSKCGRELPEIALSRWIGEESHQTYRFCTECKPFCPACGYALALHDPSCPRDEADAVERWGRAS